MNYIFKVPNSKEPINIPVQHNIALDDINTTSYPKETIELLH